MKVVNGEVVYFCHFSSKLNIQCRVLSAKKDLMLVQTEERKLPGNFLEGEPAVMFNFKESDIVITGCTICKKITSNRLMLKSDKEHTGAENRRMHERYPVSYYADLKVLNEQRRYFSYLKDISKYGIRIMTDAEISIGQKVEISLYLEKKIIFISAHIIRKNSGKNCFEYGGKIVIEDFHSAREMSSLIKMTTEEYIERFINNNLLKDNTTSNYNLSYDARTNKFILNENKDIDSVVAKFGDIIRRIKY